MGGALQFFGSGGGEPAFDQVEPRVVGRGEMEVELARMSIEKTSL